MTNPLLIAPDGTGIASSLSLHPYDDINNWLKGDFKTPPWSPKQIQDFQDRLDSAFGAKNAFVLVWSADRRYGDEFYNEHGELEKKPPLLFKEVPASDKPNEKDYIYIGVPRWMIMEVHHGSQLEAGWESASWVTDPDGSKRRVRPENPPEFYYVNARVIDRHEQTSVIGAVAPCCQRMWSNGKNVCFGRYREPDETDIAFVRGIRENQDKANVVQRNDAERCAKIIQDGNLATKHFMKRSAELKSLAVQEAMLAHPEAFFGDILKDRGATMSPREFESTVRQALEQQHEERFEKTV